MALNLPLSPHLSVRLDPDATGELLVDGSPEWFSEPNTEQLREVVLGRVGQIAATAGHPVQLTVSDEEGDWLLVVHPDGSIGDEEELAAQSMAEPVPFADAREAARHPEPTAFNDLLGAAERDPAPAAAPFNDLLGSSKPTAPVPLPTAQPETPSRLSPSRPVNPSPVTAPEPVELVPRAPERTSFLHVEKPRPDLARSGVRGALSRAGIPMSPSSAELKEREELESVSRHWAGPRTIAIVNGKGGANKTPTTALLSAVFARNGGSGVLAWDNNETRGTLGWRTEQDDHDATLQSLLPAADQLLSAGARSADIGHFVHHQNADKYDVLRSNPTMLATQQRISSADFDRLHLVATKFYRLVIIDSGNDESAERWLRMIDHTDQLVIATTALGEHAEAGALLLEALMQRDAQSARLARDAVVIVSQSERTGPESNVTRVAKGFEPLARRAVTIPFDPEMHGGRLAYDTLAPKTRRAWLHAAAAVSEGL
ncbi:MinD-like ATPase involved in chromosome partitioning or flagellar assembly [Leifsonia sp. EB41]|uniref:AAA family ATPase n=1 Tax=Leifsonia sp. EB41 TaxID=3156260 RepID=UPI003512D41C